MMSKVSFSIFTFLAVFCVLHGHANPTGSKSKVFENPGLIMQSPGDQKSFGPSAKDLLIFFGIPCLIFVLVVVVS